MHSSIKINELKSIMSSPVLSEGSNIRNDRTDSYHLITLYLAPGPVFFSFLFFKFQHCLQRNTKEMDFGGLVKMFCLFSKKLL